MSNYLSGTLIVRLTQLYGPKGVLLPKFDGSIAIRSVKFSTSNLSGRQILPYTIKFCVK